MFVEMNSCFGIEQHSQVWLHFGGSSVEITGDSEPSLKPPEVVASGRRQSSFYRIAWCAEGLKADYSKISAINISAAHRKHRLELTFDEEIVSRTEHATASSVVVLAQENDVNSLRER